MRIAIIIQARRDSKRLPDKMILPFYKGKGIFEILSDRFMECNFKIPVYLATTTDEADNILEKIAKQKGIDVYRGQKENVLERFIQATSYFNLDRFIRICADNPFIDLSALKFMINEFEKTDVDYWAYSLSNGTPTIKTHYGFWGEAVKTTAIIKIKSMTKDKIFMEHVTNYIYSNQDKFLLHFHQIPVSVEANQIRLTVDTQEDFKIAQEIFAIAIQENINFESNHLSDFVISNKNWIQKMQKEINQNQK